MGQKIKKYMLYKDLSVKAIKDFYGIEDDELLLKKIKEEAEKNIIYNYRLLFEEKNRNHKRFCSCLACLYPLLKKMGIRIKKKTFFFLYLFTRYRIRLLAEVISCIPQYEYSYIDFYKIKYNLRRKLRRKRISKNIFEKLAREKIFFYRQCLKKFLETDPAYSQEMRRSKYTSLIYKFINKEGGKTKRELLRKFRGLRKYELESILDFLREMTKIEVEEKIVKIEKNKEDHICFV